MCQKVYYALGSKCGAKQPQLPFMSLHMDQFPKGGGCIFWRWVGCILQGWVGLESVFRWCMSRIE